MKNAASVIAWQPEIQYQNSQSFYPLELFTLDHFFMRHPVHLFSKTILQVRPNSVRIFKTLFCQITLTQAKVGRTAADKLISGLSILDFCSTLDCLNDMKHPVD